MFLHELLYAKAPGQGEDQEEPGEFDLMTLFSRSRRPFKMVSAQYLKKDMMYPHQIWYIDAPGQGKDQVRTG